jgi:hypothetical protein
MSLDDRECPAIWACLCGMTWPEFLADPPLPAPSALGIATAEPVTLELVAGAFLAVLALQSRQTQSAFEARKSTWCDLPVPFLPIR